MRKAAPVIWQVRSEARSLGVTDGLGGGEGVSRGSSGRGGRWKTGVEQERGRRERGKVKMDGRMEEVMNN